MSGHGLHEQGGPPPALPRLLVVEDEAPLVRLLAGYFEREGFAVTTCADGRRGVELAGELDPEVIVLDLMLPGVDGSRPAGGSAASATPTS